MNKKPMTWPLSCVTRSAAAAAEPPIEHVSRGVITAHDEGRKRTCRNDVVHNKHLLALADGVLLHLEQILAVFLDIFGRDAGTGELAGLANSGKSDAEAQGQAGSKEEAAGIKADDHVRLGVRKGLSNLQLEGGDERGVGIRVGEQGHDVDKVDPWNREVGELAERLAQAYLCTGEFGGGGGGGGGLSSRGILSGWGGGCWQIGGRL